VTPSTAPAYSKRRLAALRHPGFAGFLARDFSQRFAVQMQTVAVGWQVYALRHDPLDLGLVGLSQFLPFIPLGLVAGHVADRFNRRRILALCYATQVLCALLLLAFTLSGVHVVWPVFAVMGLFGVARAFSMPASQAIVPTLVPIESFGNAVALSSSSFQVATIAGPTLGGLLYLAGPQTVYGVVATLLGHCLRADESCESAAGQRRRCFAPASSAQPKATAEISWHGVLEGLRFVRSRPVVLGAISLDLFAVLLGGATALLPAYARDILHVGPTGLGLLRTAPGVGAALAAFVLAFTPIARHVGRWMFAGVALFGVATVVFGLSHIFIVSLVGSAAPWHRRHGERLHPPHAGAAGHTGRDPRPGECGERRFHRRIERAWRVRVGSHRRLVWTGTGGCDRWCRDARGCGAVDALVPSAAQDRQVPRSLIAQGLWGRRTMRLNPLGHELYIIPARLAQVELSGYPLYSYSL
jgi:MFS family permease